MDIDRLKLVIFDKDGLMMETERPVMVIWREVFAKWGLPPLTEELYSEFVGLDRRDNLRQIGEFFPDIDGEKLLTECGARTREHLSNNPIETKPGLFELFDALDERGIKKVVATSSKRESAYMTLEKCGILPHVDAVVSGDMVAQSKPAPDIFLKAADTMGFCPRECLVLEDSNAGVTAAHAARIPVIVIPDIAETPPDILALCLCRCESLFDVIGMLG